MHLDQEQLERLLHGELSPTTEAEARHHLESCAHCRKQLEQTQYEETEVNALLQQLDHPAPHLQASSIAALAGQPPRTWLRWAAGLAITLGVVGGAYALPGSPLRSWVDSMARPAADQPVSHDEVDSAVSGLVVQPADDFLIQIAPAVAGSRAVVTLTDSSQIAVRVLEGTANFTTEERRLLIDNHGSALLVEIDIPRSTTRLEIRVAGRSVFLKQGGQVVTSSSADPNGQYQISLSQMPR
jgi:hypothetical protein